MEKSLKKSLHFHFVVITMFIVRKVFQSGRPQQQRALNFLEAQCEIETWRIRFIILKKYKYIYVSE